MYTQRHKFARLDWVRQHNRWVSQQGNHVVIILGTLVTSWRPTTLTRSNGLPDHQIEHVRDHLGRRLRNDVNKVNDLERALHEK